MSQTQKYPLALAYQLPPVMDSIRRRRLSVFGHIARLTQGTPAHNALHCQVGLASGRSLCGDWRRRPGPSSSLDSSTPQRHWICSLPTSGDRPFYGPYRAMMVERRDCPSWLRDDDDDDHDPCDRQTDRQTDGRAIAFSAL